MTSIFTRFWDWLLSLFWSKDITISIIGQPFAGKTTLVRAISGEDTEAETSPTIAAKSYTVEHGRVKLNVNDIGGQPRFEILWEPYCAASNAILYVIDSADEEAVKTSEGQLQSLFENEAYVNIPILVIANKQDLNEAMPQEEIISRLKLNNATRPNVHLFFASAKRKTNIDVIVRWITDNC